MIWLVLKASLSLMYIFFIRKFTVCLKIEPLKEKSQLLKGLLDHQLHHFSILNTFDVIKDILYETRTVEKVFVAIFQLKTTGLDCLCMC